MHTRTVLLLFSLIYCFSPAYVQAQEVVLNKTTSIQPKSSTEIDQSPWGLHMNGNPFHDVVAAQFANTDQEALLNALPSLIQQSQELGIKWARLSLDWPLIEDTEGKFHWELFDQMIEGLVKADIEVYPSLHAGHPVHTKNQPPRSEEELSKWLNFVNKVVKRYKHKIRYWELWNEPNTVWFWDGKPRAQEYFNLVKTTSPSIKALDKDAKIIAGSLARLDVPFMDTLMQLGIGDYIDVVSFHPYTIMPEATHKKMANQVQAPDLYRPIIHQVRQLREVMKNSSPDIALWQGECGYSSAMNTLGWNGPGPFGETIQAKWVLRRGLVDLMNGMQVSAYFLLKDFKHHRRDAYNYKGLIAYNGQLKPAYRTYQYLNATLNGAIRIKPEASMTINITEAGSFPGIQPKNIFQVALENEKYHYWVYWAATHMQESTQAGKVTIQVPASLKSPELLDLLSGDIFQIQGGEAQMSGTDLQGLPLQDYPMIIRSLK